MQALSATNGELVGCGHRSTIRDPSRQPWPAELHEPLAHPPLVLGEEHSAQLGKAGGWFLERVHDRLAILDRHSDEILVSLQGDDQRLRRVVEPGLVQEPSEVEHVVVTYSDSGEIQRGEATQSARGF
jgi:hypothetical protein